MRSTSPVLAGAALILLASACAPKTSTTQVLSAEVRPPTKLANVLVVGLGPGVVDRHELEDKLCEELSKRGVVAKPSYALFPVAVPDREALQKVAREAGIDGVVTSRVRLVENNMRYVPRTETYFAGFEHGSYTRANPGYYVNEATAEFETTVWDTKDDKQLWSAITRTVNPASGTGFAGSLAKAVLPQMQKAGLVPAEQ
jgi:hypothetical protein